MNKKIILCLSLFSFNFINSSNIFKSIESNDKKSIKQWLNAKNNLQELNGDNQTALIKSVQNNNKQLAYNLLKNNIAVNHLDNFSKTALDYAVESNNKKIIKILIKNGGKVTTEANFNHCKKILTNSRLKRIAAILIGSACLICAYAASVGIVMASAMATAMTGNGLILASAFLFIILFDTTVLYGTIKMGKKKTKYFNKVKMLKLNQ